MRTRFQSRNFGVLEIIVSVAILAVFSVPVLWLFVAASSDEKEMLELDHANYAAVSYIEQFEGSQSPFEILNKMSSTKAVSFGYDGTSNAGNNITAHIQIKKDGENAGGGLFSILVDITRTSDGTEIFRLGDQKFFSK